VVKKEFRQRFWALSGIQVSKLGVYHWTEERIRAHVFVCVLALQIERWMRNKLKGTSVPTAVRQLRQIKMVEMVSGGKTSKVPTRPTAEQKEILHKLGVPALGRAE
jgi:transposase